MSLNVVTLVGRVGMKSELIAFDSGRTKCKLTLAVRRPSRNSDEPDWFNLELWGNEARIATDYVQKGSLIGVKGSLKFDTWNDSRTGASRSSPVIRVDRLELLGSKKDTDNSFASDNPDSF